MIPSMRTHRIGPVVVLLVGLSPMVSAARAQSSPGAAPTAVADSFFRAQEQERWRDAARLMDLHTILALRDEEVSNVRKARFRTHHVTPEQLMRFDPKMPRAVAEYQAARSNEQSVRNDWLLHEYADVPSADSLAALSAEDVAARWLKAKDTRYMMRRALATHSAECNLPDSIKAELMDVPAPSYRTIGTVMADSLAYVLYTQDRSPEAARDPVPPRRARMKSAEASYVMAPPVLTLRLLDGRWRIAPSFDMSSSGVAMVACEAHVPSRKASR
jgi:hypothetical protein